MGIKYSFKLVKWDGDEPGKVEKPERDPRCVEIVEWDLGEAPKVIYRRN